MGGIFSRRNGTSTAQQAVADIEAYKQKEASNLQPAVEQTLTDAAIDAVWTDPDVAFPMVLYQQAYASTRDFFDDYEVNYSKSLGRGAFGEVRECIRFDADEAKEHTPKEWNKKSARKDRFKDAADVCAMKRQRKFVPRGYMSVTSSGVGSTKYTKEEWRVCVREKFKSWRREIETLLRLQGCSVHNVPLVDVYEDRDYIYIVTPKYAHGSFKDAWPSLNKREKKQHGLRLFMEMMHALQELETLGVVHCDIKPDNMCVINPLKQTDEPCIAIIDFGLCVWMVDDPICPGGSLLYQSPDLKVTPKSDIYSLGKVVLWMLNKGVWDTSGVEKIGNENLRDMVRTMVAKNPADRKLASEYLADASVFPQRREEKEDPDPLHPLRGLPHGDKFEAFYDDVHREFGGGDWDDEEEDSEDSDGYGSRYRARTRQHDESDEDKLARLRRQRRSLEAEQDELMAKLAHLKVLVADAASIVRSGR